MLQIKSLIFIFCLGISFSLFSQKGKNGAKLVSAANTKINEFTSLTTNASVGNTTINVTLSTLNTNARFTSTLTPGDLIMIIQMQGAAIRTYSFIPGQDSLYGTVDDYLTCGNYEFAQVKSIPSTTQIEIDCGLSYDYTSSGNVQIVRVPRYNSLTINSGGVLTTDGWNGTIGGVLAVEVDGNTIINSGGSISADGLGFRGGVAANNSGFGGNYIYTDFNPNVGAKKGEGIGSSILTNTSNATGNQGKGAPANGGGGGNAHNCGGGGGANAGNINAWNGYGVANLTYSVAFNQEYNGRALVISSGGGKGGYGFSNSNSLSPITSGPNLAGWNGDKRPSHSGFGGRPLDYTTGKLFLGGGGGAGHVNNISSSNTGGTGGNGGGLIYLLNYGSISGTGTVSSNGSNGADATGPTPFTGYVGNDGCGGGGGGGTIVLQCNNTISPIVANANGGNGGNQIIVKSLLAGTVKEAEGPGGGGGGGFIASTVVGFTKNVNGGNNGVTNSSPFITDFPSNGATSGNSGIDNQTVPSYTLVASSDQTLCVNQSATLTATSTNTLATIMWYNTAAGGNAISTGTVYVTPSYTAAGTYTVFAGSCPGIYRQPIVITVGSLTGLSVNSPSICVGQTATLTASGASSYTWTPGNINGTTYTLSPSSTTTVSLIATSGSCSGQVTSTITVSSSIPLTVNNATICTGQQTILTANGATTYTWNTTAIINSIAVTPTTTTVYTVTGTVGTCTGVATSIVLVNALPTLTVNSVNICAGQQATLTVAGANTYTWSNNVTGSTQTVSPTTATNYTVTGTNTLTGCQNTVVASVGITNSPTLSINTSSICSGDVATLTVLGVTSYTWSTLETTQTIHPTPSATTVYTVTGSNGGCPGIATATVNVFSALSITASASNTIGCADLCVTFTNIVDPSSTGIIYHFGDGSVGNINNPTHCYTTGGNYTVTATAINSVVGCSYTYTLPTAITVLSSPVADFYIQKGTSANSMVPISLFNTSTNATNYTWSLCDGSVSSSTNTSTSYNETSQCCITLLAANVTCTNSTTKCIDPEIISQLSIPNVFTPNGDGNNDRFKITSTNVKSLYCAIYDRWGLKLYESNELKASWDGTTTSGTLVPSGTYFYIINYVDSKDVSKTEKGFLSLFRD